MSPSGRAAPAGPAPLSRLGDGEALDLLERGDLLELGFRADEVRRRLHPDGAVTFVIDRNINYTDYCVSGCRFCAFFERPGSGQGYLLTREDIHRKIEETIALGGTAVMMQGGLNPDLDICWFEEVFSDIKERFPQVHLHCLSPPEVAHIAEQSGLTIEETLRREISPHKIPTDTWLEVMRVAHGLGMRTTATMMFGSRDTPAERIAHLGRIRDLQDETGGFTAFIPWTFQAGHTALEEGHVPATAVEYLRLLAVSRLYLDNVPNVQASWVTQGLRMGQVALAFGANDMGSTMIEENVVRAAGVSHTITVEEMVRLIRAAGFTPVQRDTLYGEVRRFD